MLKIKNILIAGLAVMSTILTVSAQQQTITIDDEDFPISITGVVSEEPEKFKDIYSVYTCEVPATVTLLEEDGCTFAVEPIISFDKYFYDAPGRKKLYCGDDEESFFTAKKGAKITVETPGLYRIWTAYDAEPPVFRYINVKGSVKPTPSKIIVDGEEVNFEGYNIADNNYFKLRDVAKVISGSQKQFDVSWDDEKSAINLISNQKYTEVGGELVAGDGQEKQAQASVSSLFKDLEEVQACAYLIEGNNYFKLRDLGELFNFGIDWDKELNSIVIDTTKEYSIE